MTRRSRQDHQTSKNFRASESTDPHPPPYAGHFRTGPLSLGMTNFAGGLAIGLAGVDVRLRLRVAVAFGLFEGGMPLLASKRRYWRDGEGVVIVRV